MDERMYEIILERAKYTTIARFQDQYRMCGSMTKCEIYQEVKDLCKILNVVAPYANRSWVVPVNLLKMNDLWKK